MSLSFPITWESHKQLLVVVHHNFSVEETWRRLCLNNETAAGYVLHLPDGCRIIKSNKNKSIFDRKGRIMFKLILELSVEKIWSGRRTKCISFQTTENQTNYRTSASEAPEQ